jgi:hypothetical protein
VGWLFGRSKEQEKKSILSSEIPRDSERLGPAPPPARTTQQPGVVIYGFAGLSRQDPFPIGVSLLSPAARKRPAGTFVEVVPAGASLKGPGSSSSSGAALVLSGALIDDNGRHDASAGDIVFAASGQALSLTNTSTDPVTVLWDVSDRSASSTTASHVVRRETLEGVGFVGITGIRATHRTSTCTSLRLGPPPGARWVLLGVRGFAVFAGKIVVIDGDEPTEVHAGHVAVVSDPTATLYLQAGNDSGIAIGFASRDVVVALG